MKARVLLIVAGLLAACQRDLPTASKPTSSAVSLTAEQARIARIALTDVLERIVPALSSADAAPLASSLTRLLATVSEGPVEGAALARAVEEVMQYERATDTDGAELAAIRLALATVQN